MELRRDRTSATDISEKIEDLSYFHTRGGGTGGGGARGAMPPPPKNLNGWAKVCFGPPPKF